MARVAYDVAVIGSGSGGLTAAKTARGFGKRVVLIEKEDHLGGECTWTGCVPSKALIKTAEVAYHAQHLTRYGLNGQVKIDTTGVMDDVRNVIRQVYQTHTPEKIKELGIDVVFGSASFIDNNHIQVGDQTIQASKIIICTGLSPFVPPIEGLDQVNYLTNETLFDLPELPRSMIILGGGPIGAEMASALNRLGVAVTMIEMQDRILPKEDPELVDMLSAIMRDEGVKLLSSIKAIRVQQAADDIAVVCQDENGQEKRVQGQTLLVAVGRRPNLQGLSLERAGIEINKHGIVVDSTLRTTAKNIYAAGDVVGPYLFSHMAWHQAVIATRNALIPLFKKHIDYRHIIWVTFTAPELAAAGLTEVQAREQYGDTIRVYKKSYAEIDRGHTDRTTQGLAKFICDKKGRLLGTHILGERAGDIIHELQLAKVHGIRLADLHSIIHAYPTYSELAWHASKRAYVDRLEANIFIQLIKKLFIR